MCTRKFAFSNSDLIVNMFWQTDEISWEIIWFNFGTFQKFLLIENSLTMKF